MSTLLPVKPARWQLWLRWLLLILLLGLLVFGTVPGYLKGSWRWQQPPRIEVLQNLRSLRQQGLSLPGWQTLQQRVLPMGEHTWSVQELQDANKHGAILFLFPQNGPKDQPQVEWTDMDGAQQWQSDSYQSLQFRTGQPAVTVNARFFRAWNSRQTYGVLQWYAWPEGGDAAPSHWFVADRLAQLQNRRQPWVTVCLLIPMEPLDDLAKYRDQITALGQTVQSALLQSVFQIPR